MQFWNSKILYRCLPIICFIVMGLIFHYLLSLKYGVAIPTIHDEFAYLLNADTFAQGRLTNPTPPMWEHFQTFHVFGQPTYQAKYPPFQGLFMAFGQIVWGSPIWGVWFSLALAYGATYWLFRSRFTPLYALVGTMVLATHPMISLHWGHTYWGGAVALLGGALFFGGLLRSQGQVSLSVTVVMGMGIIILAFSRPFESFILFILSIPMFIKITLGSFARSGKTATIQFFLLPVAVLGCGAIVFLLYYNAVLTGDPFKYYYLNWKASATTIDMIKSYVGSPPLPYLLKIVRFWDFYIGPLLSLAFIGIVLLLMRKKMIFELASVIGLGMASIYYSKAWPHYLAPVGSLVYLIVFSGLYEIKNIGWLRRKKMAQPLFAIVMGLYFVIAVLDTYALFEKGPARPYIGKLHLRKEITRKLIEQAGRDLVIVTYASNHNSHEEWVYNRADLVSAEIVWARDLGDEKNRRLVEYFHDRTVWRLYPDRKPIGLVRMNPAGSEM